MLTLAQLNLRVTKHNGIDLATFLIGRAPTRYKTLAKAEIAATFREDAMPGSARAGSDDPHRTEWPQIGHNLA